MAHAKLNLQRMLTWIEQCLDADRPTPDDAAICHLFGFDSTESARTLLAELADAGRITIRGYGDTRVISLGRTTGGKQALGRVEPTIKRADPSVDEAAARLIEIANRGRKPAAAVAAENAGKLLATVTYKPAVKKPAPIVQEEPVMPAEKKRTITFVASGAVLAHIEARMEREKAPIGRIALEMAEAALQPIAPPRATPSPASAPSLDELLRMIRAHFDDQPDQSAELAAAVARAEAAENRASVAEHKFEQAKALFA